VKRVEGAAGGGDAQLDRLERSVGAWPRRNGDVGIGLDVGESGLDDQPPMRTLSLSTQLELRLRRAT